MARKKKIWMPDYTPTDFEQEAYMWGINEGIIISPMGIKANESEWHVGISSHWTPKEVTKSPVTYDKNEIWQKVFEYYIYYYEKHLNKKKPQENPEA